MQDTISAFLFVVFGKYPFYVSGSYVLDGVGDALMLNSNREVLQGRPKAHSGGKSATMMYSYKYTFCNRAIVATLDLSAQNLNACFKLSLGGL